MVHDIGLDVSLKQTSICVVQGLRIQIELARDVSRTHAVFRQRCNETLILVIEFQGRSCHAVLPLFRQIVFFDAKKVLRVGPREVPLPMAF
jgi:hypothetical protein